MPDPDIGCHFGKESLAKLYNSYKSEGNRSNKKDSYVGERLAEMGLARSQPTLHRWRDTAWKIGLVEKDW